MLPSRSVQVFQRATGTYIVYSRRLGAVHYSTRPLLLFFLGVSTPVTFSKARHFGVYLFVYPRSILRRTISLKPFIYAGFRVLLRSCPRTDKRSEKIQKRLKSTRFRPFLLFPAILASIASSLVDRPGKDSILSKHQNRPTEAPSARHRQEVSLEGNRGVLQLQRTAKIAKRRRQWKRAAEG